MSISICVTGRKPVVVHVLDSDDKILLNKRIKPNNVSRCSVSNNFSMCTVKFYSSGSHVGEVFAYDGSIVTVELTDDGFASINVCS